MSRLCASCGGVAAHISLYCTVGQGRAVCCGQLCEGLVIDYHHVDLGIAIVGDYLYGNALVIQIVNQILEGSCILDSLIQGNLCASAVYEAV